MGEVNWIKKTSSDDHVRKNVATHHKEQDCLGETEKSLHQVVESQNEVPKCSKVTSSPFTIVHMKMKRLKLILAQWSKVTFGDIFKKIATLEDVIKEKEVQPEIAPTEGNKAEFSKVNVDLNRYRKLEEEFWKQKADRRWFKDGDSNTKFFHAYAYGFFQSSRGLKQGDPLSPTLFIIAAEVLSRSLNGLFEDSEFRGFGMPKWSPQINHLYYADDTILFFSG
ncbi:uncharacterized protein LOC125873619 [Solanum stenotomum]|uniref:uncharacterized protein LOC125873619 n=1 Tax=Solanum stenotomum TaxID=172797 RepID=UPI0020D02FD7|nr:uncharacterized protein LOC125873619 [Solanum stenotomum]